MIKELVEALKSISAIIQGNSDLQYSFLIINFLIGLIFFLIHSFISNENDRDRHVHYSTYSYYNKIIIGTLLNAGIGGFFLIAFGSNSIIISPILGIIASLYLIDKFYIMKEIIDEPEIDKIDTSENINYEEGKNPTNIKDKEIYNSVKNDLNENFELLSNNTVKLPSNVSILNLDLISILEMYGYISENQKFKTITQSFFEDSDEQIKRLLKMHALEEFELKEAHAILNLIKLKKKIVTKEEALKCIMDLETARRNQILNSSEKDKDNCDK